MLFTHGRIFDNLIAISSYEQYNMYACNITAHVKGDLLKPTGTRLRRLYNNGADLLVTAALITTTVA